MVSDVLTRSTYGGALKLKRKSKSMRELTLEEVEVVTGGIPILSGGIGEN